MIPFSWGYMSKQIQQEGYGKSISPKHLKAARFPKVTASRPVFLPSDLEGLQLWCKYNSGITVTGAGVSQWDDVSGNANHLKQGTDGNRPDKQSDGSILFNGTADYLRADAFTLEQPETIYLLGRQVTWTLNDNIMDGNTANTGQLFQSAITPDIKMFAGSVGAAVGGWVVNEYAILIALFNGVSSVFQINNGTATTVNPGAGDMGGFTLGLRGDEAGGFGNIQVKEVAIFSTAHDAATRLQMTAYLAQIGSLNI